VNSAERAAKLAVVRDDEAERVWREERALAQSRKVGSWRWTPIGDELHLRSKALPTIRIDVTRSEARDLMAALAAALNEVLPVTPQRAVWLRLTDWLARRTWNRKHEVERAWVLKEMADEFRERGGW